MRFKKSPQLPGAGRTRAWHHHESHTPISPGALLLSNHIIKHIGRQCIITHSKQFACYQGIIKRTKQGLPLCTNLMTLI